MYFCVKRKTRQGHTSYIFVTYFVMKTHSSTSKYKQPHLHLHKKEMRWRHFSSKYTLRSENVCARRFFYWTFWCLEIFNICFRSHLITLCQPCARSVDTQINKELQANWDSRIASACCDWFIKHRSNERKVKSVFLYMLTLSFFPASGYYTKHVNLYQLKCLFQVADLKILHLIFIICHFSQILDVSNIQTW